VGVIIFPMATRNPSPPPRTSKKLSKELEQILAEIEKGEVGLEESLLPIEQGDISDSALPEHSEHGREADRIDRAEGERRTEDDATSRRTRVRRKFVVDKQYDPPPGVSNRQWRADTWAWLLCDGFTP
jgi:hypothetical protein